MSRGPSPIALGADEVHVWHTRLEALGPEEAQARYLDWLSAAERAKLARFLFPRHRHQYLVAHALVRDTLSRYVAAPPAAWQFTTVANGRPEISEPDTGPRRLRFNLSHTDGRVVCGVVWDHDLGVDVEDLARRPVSEGLPERYFAPAEVADLRALPAAEQPRVFFDYWTLKEAYIKARGLGLALPLEKFAYRLGGQEVRITFADDLDDDPASWQFAQCRPSARHVISVAVRRGSQADLKIHFQEVVPGER